MLGHDENVFAFQYGARRQTVGYFDRQADTPFDSNAIVIYYSRKSAVSQGRQRNLCRRNVPPEEAAAERGGKERRDRKGSAKRAAKRLKKKREKGRKKFLTMRGESGNINKLLREGRRSEKFKAS